MFRPLLGGDIEATLGVVFRQVRDPESSVFGSVTVNYEPDHQQSNVQPAALTRVNAPHAALHAWWDQLDEDDQARIRKGGHLPWRLTPGLTTLGFALSTAASPNVVDAAAGDAIFEIPADVAAFVDWIDSGDVEPPTSKVGSSEVV